ncbi:MAG: FAD-binding oxidoreductase, partial [Stackebrandtia sp.]
MIDRRPSVIVRCRTAEDVSLAVRYAVLNEKRLTVRGGGHNVAGTAVDDDAVMVDLSLMRDVVVDTKASRAYVDGGATLLDVDAATVEHGLACPSGVVSETGLGGLALGGGYGWLARKWGLTCDHIVAADVVLADGSRIHVSQDDQPELLWGLRGGGGNFGVVTRFELLLRPVGSAVVRTAKLPASPARVAAYREFAAGQTDDLQAVITLHGPERAGEPPTMTARTVWIGAPEPEAAACTALFRALECAPPPPVTMSHLDLQT